MDMLDLSGWMEHGMAGLGHVKRAALHEPPIRDEPAFGQMHTNARNTICGASTFFDLTLAQCPSHHVVG